MIYIHNNPVNHGFVEDAIDYAWTSYLTVKSHKPTNLQRNKVIKWFDDIENFMYLHKINENNKVIEKFILE